MLILISPWKTHLLFLQYPWKFHITHPPPPSWLVSHFHAWCESDSLTVTVTACSDIFQSLKYIFILLISLRFLGPSPPNLLPTFIFQHLAAYGEELTSPL